MTAPDEPETPAGDVLSGLPRTRVQRRSTRRVSAPEKGADTPKAAVRPAAKKPARTTAAKAAAKKPARTGTPKAAAKPRKAPVPAPAARAKPSPAGPLLDHPEPKAVPGAPFAPPPAGGAGTAPRPAQGIDVVGLAGDLAQAGINVAKAILDRLPKP